MRLVLAWVVYIYLCYVCLGDATTVLTPVGNIKGMQEVVNTDDGPVVFTKFLGIPYAESTAGENRFKKPVPQQSFTDTFDATRVPLGCVQATPDATKRFSQITNFSEDCLTLNIYVPHDFSQNTSLSVMIWIHGGAFVSDTAAAYKGDVLSTLGNVIVVTFNYRLGMFGFLRSGDGSLIGNQGLWDQHLAIKWVHDNIEAFGGDANDVTLFGGKAGGVCATFQALYPGNKGYFRRVIAQSGSALAYWGNLEKPNAEDYIKAIRCQNQPRPIDCLYAKSPEELQLETYSVVGELVFRPGVDNDFLVEEPYQIIFGNNPKSASSREFFASLDMIIVVTNFDGAVFLSSRWPSILNYTDINDFTMTRKLFIESAIPDIVQSVIKPVDYNSGEVFKQLLDFIYTDWSKPNDSAALLLHLTDMSGDTAFFYPAVSIANGHSLLRSGKTYFSVFSVDPTHHVIPTPSWITGNKPH